MLSFPQTNTDTETMETSTADAAVASAAGLVDPLASAQLAPGRILESLVSELEILRSESNPSDSGLLIELHGALFLYELGGDLDRLPTLGFSLSSRRLLERRVVLAARRLGRRGIESSVHRQNMERANAQIIELIHLIDPELRALTLMAS
jgi:hypothetical protein